MATNRPSLMKVLGARQGDTPPQPIPAEPTPSAPVSQPETSPAAVSAIAATPAASPAPAVSSPRRPRKPSKRASGWKQICLLLPDDLREAALIRAMREHRDLSDIVADMLRTWVAR